MSKRKGRIRYAPEFRRQMVELVRAGRTPEELAREFEPTANTIRKWVEQLDQDEGLRTDGLTEVSDGNSGVAARMGSATDAAPGRRRRHAIRRGVARRNSLRYCAPEMLALLPRGVGCERC